MLHGFPRILIAVLERAFEQFHRRRRCGRIERKYNAFAVFPTLLFDQSQLLISPLHALKAHWKVRKLARRGIKGCVQQIQAIPHSRVLARIAAIARFHPENGSGCITSPFVVARPRSHCVMNIWNVIFQRFVR